MILLVASATQRTAKPSRSTGDFISPRAWKHVGKTKVWAADNDGFSGFHPDRYRRMLDNILAGVIARGGKNPPAFVTIPDVVCNHERTMELYYEWHQEVGGRGLNRALVLQNGIEDAVEWRGWNAVAWDEVEALFIGGDTAFKFSEHVRFLVHAAKAEGKWVHMGRVNSVRRLNYARSIGCDSVDGSGMARFSDSVLLPMLHSLRQRQLQLF